MKVRLVADIDEDVKKKAQIYAIQNDATLGEITEKALMFYLNPPEAEKKDSELEIN